MAGGRRKVLAVGELLIKLLASGQVRSGELVCAREARGSKILYEARDRNTLDRLPEHMHMHMHMWRAESRGPRRHRA